MAELLDLDLPSGRVRVERAGAGEHLVLCVHGLSANVRGFDAIAPALAAEGRQVAAVDLRGRGRSPDTGRGTYGLDAHAADVIAVADALGATTFDLVGWSMGALITVRVAGRAPDRLRRAVLVDAAGNVDPGAIDAVRAGLARLDAVVPDPETYWGAIQAVGVIGPWGPFWERYFAYELEQRADGTWSPSTSRTAALEDLEAEQEDLRAYWPNLTMPVLLVRATVPLGGGMLVNDDELTRLRETVPRLEVAEVQRNHYGVMDAPETVAAIADFLR